MIFESNDVLEFAMRSIYQDSVKTFNIVEWINRDSIATLNGLVMASEIYSM